MSSIIDRARADLHRAQEAADRAMKEAGEARVIADRAIAERDDLAAFVARLDRYAQEEPAAVHAAPNGKPLTMIQEIEAVLRSADRPLLVTEIIAAIQKRGREVGGKDPAANVASILSRKAQFKFQKGRGWSLISAAQILDTLLPPSGAAQTNRATG